MRRSVGIAMRLLVAGWLPLAGLADGISPVSTLEGVVGRWVDLRGQADAEDRAWTAQAAQWRQESELLTAEQAKLTAALATLEEAGETQQEQGAALMARRERLAAVLADVDAAVIRLQPSLSAMRPLVPSSLMTGELAAALDPGTAEPGEPAGVVARLQRALGALKALEELQGAIHTAREMIALPTGPRREMDVLYFGLSCGFAVSADGSAAAAGRPGAGGWAWEAVPALASDIRRLLRIANQDEPPALAVFPVAAGLAPSVWRLPGEGGQ